MNINIFKFNNKKGFTLIEVIIALCILAISSAAIITMFTSSLRQISLSGEKNIAQYTAQKALEGNIAGENNNISNINTSVNNNVKVTLKFGGNHYDVDGKIIKSTYNDGKTSFSITTFVPN